MTLALLGRMRKASFKGVSFLVKNSNIVFGQQTVTHKYPNSDKTEVEFLGLSGSDRFDLELIVHGADYLEKRNRLKKILEEPSLGLLIHPFQGEIKCSVVSASLVENDANLGLAKFSVTFQKSNDPSYPTTATNTKNLILRNLDAVLNKTSSLCDSLTSDYSNNSILTATKLGDVADSFDNALALTYKLTDKANEISTNLLDFKSKINTYALTPNLLGSSLKKLWDNLNFISSDNKEQIRILKSFYSFGSLDMSVPENTLERIERKKTFKAINDTMIVNSLALSYATASEIDYDNDQDLQSTINDIEAQFDSKKEDLNNDIIDELNNIRENTLAYLSNLDLVTVTEKEIKPTSLVLLSFQQYGTVEKYDSLLTLNKFYDPAFIKGKVKILNE